MIKRPLIALALALPLFGAPLMAGAPLGGSASAQAIGICGLPGTPPCERPDRSFREERREGSSRPRGDLSRTCVTRDLRCRTDEPRPVGARCQCFDEDDDAQPGRVR